LAKEYGLGWPKVKMPVMAVPKPLGKMPVMAVPKTDGLIRNQNVCDGCA
jgi:hypothetical protein